MNRKKPAAPAAPVCTLSTAALFAYEPSLASTTSADALLAPVDVVVIVALPALTDSPPAVTVSPDATVTKPSPRTLNFTALPASA